MARSRMIFGVVLIAIGLSWLFDFPVVRFLIAAGIIWLGLQMLTDGKSNVRVMEQTETEEDVINRVLIFSGINKKVVSKNFEGGELVAVFGGGEVDLSEVKAKDKEVEMEVVAVFGGLKLRVPKDWKVKSEGVGVLGSFDNKVMSNGGQKVTLVVKGTAIFGGVEVVS